MLLTYRGHSWVTTGDRLGSALAEWCPVLHNYQETMMQEFGKKIPATRTVAREGVNAAQTSFGRYGCVFQEVAQQNDFGKDAYVDIAGERTVTHLCVALQIKSGESFKTARGDYPIPVEKHAESWRR